MTEHRSQAAQVQQFIKDLKKTGNEKPDPPQAQMYISLLGKIGREAEPALPILKQIANDETAEAQTREYAKAAIEKIQNAIDD